jgi:hypothetical protein
MENDNKEKGSSEYHKEIMEKLDKIVYKIEKRRMSGTVQNNEDKIDRIDKRIKKIHKKLIWSSITGYIKVVLILGPIIIGIIWLSPFVKKYFSALEPVLKALHLSPENVATFKFGPISNFFDHGDLDNNSNILDDDITKALCDIDIRKEIINQVCE